MVSVAARLLAIRIWNLLLSRTLGQPIEGLGVDSDRTRTETRKRRVIVRFIAESMGFKCDTRQWQELLADWRLRAALRRQAGLHFPIYLLIYIAVADVVQVSQSARICLTKLVEQLANT
jgi:hypothetical protein